MMRRVVITWIFLLVSLLSGVYITKSASMGRQDVKKYENLWKDSVYSMMEKYGIHHQDIVYAQAVLETGNFTSKIFRTKNNMFGLRGRKGYYSFEHWSESVKMYKEKIQSRYREGEDYYAFLKRIHYAEAHNYTSALKKLVRKNEHK